MCFNWKCRQENKKRHWGITERTKVSGECWLQYEVKMNTNTTGVYWANVQSGILSVWGEQTYGQTHSSNLKSQKWICNQTHFITWSKIHFSVCVNTANLQTCFQPLCHVWISHPLFWSSEGHLLFLCRQAELMGCHSIFTANHWHSLISENVSDVAELLTDKLTDGIKLSPPV